ncbi:MAG: GMP synthase-like glutamine amidotransferase [Bacteroidia bacterium]|jgi:GMP synthase (glutamine-hydrolysing)
MASETRPLLLLDCYLDAGGCPALFHPTAETQTTVVLPPHIPLDQLDFDLSPFSGMVITGSAASVLDELPWSLCVEQLIQRAFADKLPLFGVCYGHQLIAKTLFGKDQVQRSPTPEFGWLEVKVESPAGPVQDAPESFECFLSHYDEVLATPAPGLQVLASSERCAVQAFRHEHAPIWGVQFHAEMAFEEARAIFVERVGNSPELGIDADAMLAKAQSTEELWRGIYSAFLKTCRA